MAVRVRSLSKRFGAQTAIAGIDFEIARGEVFGLLGPNGAGKTTTLRLLAGIYVPDEGEVEVCGLSVRSAADAVRAQVGLLTEQPGLYDRLTALENLEFSGALYGVPAAILSTRIEAWLSRFGMWEHRHRRAGTLSKGMRQKVAIARAVIHAPPVVLLDEPTSGLDPEAARTVREAIAQLATEGRTLVLCSHNLVEVERLCRRAVVMRPSPSGGRLVGSVELGLRADNDRVTVELAGPAEGLLTAARACPAVAAAEAVGPTLQVQLREGLAGTPELVATLVAQGARILAVQPRAHAVEDAYLEMVREEDPAKPVPPLLGVVERGAA